MRSTFVFRLAILLSLSGCSVLLTRGPRTNDTPVVAGHQQSPPDCTTSMTWPTIDGILAGIFTIAVLTTISDNNQNGGTSGDMNQRDSDVAASIILAGAAGISAFIGHTRVTRCRRATETYTASYYGQQQQYAYPQQYPQQPQYQYPQQYPPQAPQQYPTQPQPAPVVQPVAPPVSQPPGRQPAPAPVAKQPAPAPAPPVAKQPAPAPKPPAPAPKAPVPPKTPDPVGTEGDVCAAQSDCGAGLTCTGNVCLKAK